MTMNTPELEADRRNRVRRLRRLANRKGLVLTKDRNLHTYNLVEPTPRGPRVLRSVGKNRLDALEEELNKPIKDLPPDITLDNGTVIKTLVCDPCWLHVVAVDGVTFVYRSVRVEDVADNRLYWPALDAIEGLTPLGGGEVIKDARMVGGQAVLAAYGSLAA